MATWSCGVIIRLITLLRVLTTNNGQPRLRQALLRLAERTVGVPARTAKSSKTAKSTKKTPGTSRKRKRRPVARALRAAKALKVSEEFSVDESAGSGDHAADVKS